jgi:peptide/nickel transport system substrate-binding protein
VQRLVATALLGAFGLLAACGGGPSPQPDSTPGTLPSPHTTIPSPGPTEQFATEATLALGVSGEPANWNPLASGASRDPVLAVVAESVLPSAFVSGTDQTPSRDDNLVVSATETSAAPETVVYNINSRAVWSDGVPITGADFVYTWEAQSGQSRFRDLRAKRFTPASTSGYSRIASVATAAGNPDKVTVTFASPDPDWRSLFDPVLPAHVARVVGFDHGFTDPVSLVSGGPFLVQSYHPGDDVVLVRNPRWWGPAANLATLDLTFVTSTAEAAASLEAGQLGAAVTPFAAQTVAALAGTDGLTVTVTNGADFDDLVFDERSGPLAVRAVRLAVMLAIDRRSLARRAAATGDTAAAPVRNRAFPPGATGYRDETAVAGLGAPAAAAQARQLLAAAGYLTSGSTLTHDGKAVRLTLAVDTTSPLSADEVAAVVQGCRSIGIAVSITASPVSPPGRKLTAHRSDMSVVAAPLTASTAVLTTTYGTGGAGNLSGYSSPLMDERLSELASAPSLAERDEIVDQIDATAWSDAIDLPLLGVPAVLTYQSRYAELRAAPSGTGLADDVALWGIPQST